MRSFVTTFSQTSPLSPIRATSTVSSMSPAVRRRWLWQVTQYLSRYVRRDGIAVESPPDRWVEAPAACWAGAGPGPGNRAA